MVTATPVSATEVAAAAGLAHAAASYHLRQLAAAGLVDPVDTARVPGRGGRPRQRYRMREDGLDVGPESSQLLNRALLSELDRRLEDTGPGSSRTVDAEVWLSEDDWQRVVDLIQEASAVVHERALPPGTPASKHVGFTTLLFELR